MMKILGIILLIIGLVMMAGSGNDCDGKCMETANTIGEMLVVASLGLATAAIGVALLITGENNAKGKF